MKIVCASNFNLDLYQETIVAENVSGFWGKELVDTWNQNRATDDGPDYLRLVEDDYELYDGYADLR